MPESYTQVNCEQPLPVYPHEFPAKDAFIVSALQPNPTNSIIRLAQLAFIGFVGGDRICEGREVGRWYLGTSKLNRYGWERIRLLLGLL